MTLDNLFALFANHQWTIGLAFIVGTLARFSKPDVIFPSLPARWRPVFVAGVAIVVSCTEAIIAGTPLTDALIVARDASALAILTHVFGIQFAMNGKEIPMPALVKAAKGAAPEEPKRIKLDQSIVLLVATLALPACTAQQLRDANSAREALCDIVGDEQKAAFEQQAKAIGSTLDDVMRVWKESCKVRISAAETESVGAIGAIGTIGAAK